MKLKLVVPGLAWLDDYDGAEVCKDLPLPAFQWLLGRGVREKHPVSLADLLSAQVGEASTDWVQMVVQQSGLADVAEHWLIADPIHIRVNRDRALLADIGVMALSQQEAGQLISSLNHHFAEDGVVFHAPTPGRWLMSLPKAAAARFSPLWNVVGEDINEHLPQGEEGLLWSRLLNEVQMLLYTHPVNDEREARGELAVNSVWMWGNERLTGVATDPAELLLADDDTLGLLARSAGVALDAAPYDFAALMAMSQGKQHVSVVLDTVQSAAQYRDAWGWREGLEQLEQRWFAPLMQALQQGRIRQLQLQAHGPAGFELTITPAARWRFWQRPAALASLY